MLRLAPSKRGNQGTPVMASKASRAPSDLGGEVVPNQGRSSAMAGVVLPAHRRPARARERSSSLWLVLSLAFLGLLAVVVPELAQAGAPSALAVDIAAARGRSADGERQCAARETGPKSEAQYFAQHDREPPAYEPAAREAEDPEVDPAFVALASVRPTRAARGLPLACRIPHGAASAWLGQCSTSCALPRGPPLR